MERSCDFRHCEFSGLFDTEWPARAPAAAPWFPIHISRSGLRGTILHEVREVGRADVRTPAEETRILKAEEDKVSLENLNQIAVLSSQPAAIGKLFLTVEEAAQRLGVTVGWIYERTRRKAIPHRKLGKFVRFTEEDLQAIVEAAAKGSLQ